MKKILILCLAGSCGLVCAQTNPPPQVEITSDSGHFDGKASQMIYLGHVFVTDNVKAKLFCNQLTVDLPMSGGHPTNIVADTDVVIDYLDAKGQTNHLTADRAVYAYSVVTNEMKMAVTNETVTFTGGTPMPRMENSQVIILSEPLVYNAIEKQFIFTHYKTILKQSPKAGNDTNASPFNFLK
jgi:lipopolysaccharide export system protein LptA